MPTSTARQHLVLMKGFPATGKSLLASRLSQALSWPLIDKDDVKDHTLDLENGNALAYAIMWSVTRRQLALGLSVIVDSPLTYPVAFDTATDLAKGYGAHLLIVETQLDDEIWRARLDARDPDESDHKIAGWSAMQKMLEQYEGCWQFNIPKHQHMVVDASLSEDVLLSQVMHRLQVPGDTMDLEPCVTASSSLNIDRI